MSEQRLTEEQALEAAFRFVLQYRLREKRPRPESLDLMLVHMHPTESADAAAADDWHRCVEQTLNGEPIPTTW
jgi:hypothetical protein